MATFVLAPFAASGAQTPVPPACGSAYASMTPERLEALVHQGGDPQVRCAEDRLVAMGEQAVPVLIRLLHDDRPASYCVATKAIARREALAGGRPDDSSDMDVFLSMMICVGGPPRGSGRSAAYYMLSHFGDPENPAQVSPKGFALFWKFTDGYDDERLAALPLLLAKDILSAQTVSVLGPFLADLGGQAADVLPALRAGLHVPQLGAGLVDAFLKVQGNDVGIAHLLTVYAASSDDAMHTAIEAALKKRAWPAELDMHLLTAARNPAWLPAALDLMRRGMASPATIAYFIERLNAPSAADAIDVFTALGQDNAQAHQRLRALLAATKSTDSARRAALSKAIAMTAPLQERVTRGQMAGSCTGPACFETACRCASLLASLGPLPADVAVLKTAYRDGARAGATQCLATVAKMIADLHSRDALAFLYERFLLGVNEDHMYLLSQILKQHIGQVLPRIEADIGSLRDGPLAAVESLLSAPAARDALARQRARVLPDLLTQPLRKDADQLVSAPIAGYSQVLHSGPGMMLGPYPATRGALAVHRIAQLAPMTAEVVTALLRVVAGPYDEAGDQAVAVLSRIRNAPRSLRAARLKEIETLLAATPEGSAQSRLESLRMDYRPLSDAVSPEKEMD